MSKLKSSENIEKTQIKKLDVYQPEMSALFEILLAIVIEGDFQESVESINNLFDEKAAFKINSEFASDIISCHLPVKHFLKIGLLLMLCFPYFMLNFHHQRTALSYDTDAVALQYDKNQDVESAFQANEKFVKKEKFDDHD